MTRRIQLRRDTAANWIAVDPVLAAGEVGVDLDTMKIKVGNGADSWTELDYLAGDGAADLTGYATEQYVDDAVSAIEIPDVSNFITADDLPAPVDLTGYALTTDIPDVSNFITAEDIPSIPADISDLTDTEGLLGQGGEGLPTITIPAEEGTTYKGLQVSYGVVHSNSNSSELNVNKIVIHKPAVTTTTIHPTSSQDDFQVSGLGDSDILAFFVLYGDVNGPKPLATLKAFAEAAIDNVILQGGVAGEYNTAAAMRSAFYDNIATLTTAAGGLMENFEFFEFNTSFSVSADLSGQGTGSGFNVNGLTYELDTDTVRVSGWSNGSGYTVNDVIVIPGTSISYEGTPLVSPDNDITITITSVNFSGFISSFDVAGTLPRPEPQWPENNIPDGGADQYDNANYISTNLATEMSYNGGELVEDGATEFGTGSSYSFLYSSSIFGLVVTGNSATLIRTSGNSGADGNSTTEAGNIYGPSTAEQTFTNAITHLSLVGDPYAGPAVSFARSDNGSEVDILIEDDGDGAGIGITRANNGGGIYNIYREEEWDEDVSPSGTLWNIDGWDNLTNVESRTYLPLYAAFGFGGLGNKIVGTECVMYLPDNGKYYTVKFSSWTQGGNGGGFAYERRELDLTSLVEGIRFADGTVQKTAFVPTNVKSTASGNRRIEEVYGNNTVSVTEQGVFQLTTLASRSVEDDIRIWIDSSTTEIDEIINSPSNYGIVDSNTIEFSIDNINWYAWNGSTSFSGDERGYILSNITLTYNQGDTIYFRYVGGGAPAVWWDKRNLPGGSTNFRGAIIDYHAFTGESTIIGTIHIVDDDGEEHITHTEVTSGSTDGANDDLWVVPNEGRISYRRIDGEAKTLKIHWSARVFYGSELYD